MAFQFSTASRNAALDAIETAIGASAIMTIRTGAAPADCATANAGTVLATINLPADWLANAASGSKAKSGTWEDTVADAGGTAGHFRIHDSTGTTCHIQGTCGVGSGDLQLDNTSINAGQDVLITAFSITAGGA